MDGLTVRPRAPRGALAWQGAILPRCIPRPKGFAPLGNPRGEPSCSLRPMTEALPLGHHSGAIPPLKTRTRAIAPLTTRRRLSRPGTHDQSLRALDDAQAAFMPLHPDEGIPLDPAAGAIRQKGGALDR